MRALLCTQWCHYKDLECTEVTRPELRPGCVRIAVQYATISFGQLLVVAGKYQRKPPLPFVPGTEIAGVVTEVADDVSEFTPGDRVVAGIDWGGYAEEATATVHTTWRVPDSVDLSVAVSVPLTYGTSHAALHWRVGLQAGQSVLIYGAAGGVGLAAVEIARAAGAKVIAVAGSDERVALAQAHGAELGLVHGGTDLGKRIKALNDGRPVDVAFDPVGGKLFDEALRCVRPEGKILLIGFASGTVPRIPANLLLVKNIDVIGFNFGLYLGWGLTDERAHFAARMRAMMDTLMEQVAAGQLTPTSSTCFPLERFVDAFDAVAHRQTVGRALLKIPLTAGRSTPATRGLPGSRQDDNDQAAASPETGFGDIR